MQLIGRRYDNGQPIWLEVNGSGITSTGIWRETNRSHLPWIAPGLVDLQINGYKGHEFTDPQLTTQRVVQICCAADAGGVTRMLATVTTQAYTVMEHSLRTIARAIEQCDTARRRVAGIHLEGPYISAQDGPRGAHPLDHCRPHDWDEFQRLQQAADGQIRLLTLSPEYPGCAEFIRRVVDSGVLVALGHTAASSAQIQAAVDAGARLSTHLGNGAHGMIRRHPNYIWDQLADDRLTATLIADGHHLPPAVIKCFVRVKTPKRIILISDIAGLAGMPPGIHDTPNQGQVEVSADGLARLANNDYYLAGATLQLSSAICNVMQYADVDLAAAIDMASGNPAQLIGLPIGRLEPGCAADLIQFELPDDGGPAHIVATINQGECVFGEEVRGER